MKFSFKKTKRMKNFTLLLISGLLYSGLSYAQTDQIYTRPNEKTAKAPEKKISQFMKPVNKTTRNNDNSIWAQINPCKNKVLISRRNNK